MDHTQQFQRLPALLLPWYSQNKRELPWRKDKDPYHIWISEIMLQQTRVEAVKGYYARFLEALPTVEALADADDDLLHKLWEGLGYYTRIRNLKKAARCIVEQCDGIFPGEYEKILSLPGIGPYTAGAISSIAFDLPTPAVDGNVLRVISRLTDDSTPIDSSAYKNAVQKALTAVYPRQAGDFTQALMELGATVCGPNRKPDCENCPCKDICLGFKNHTAESLPVKAPKGKRRIEDKTVFVLNCGELYAVEKRPAKGLLAGLWQFPNIADKLEIPEAIAWLESIGLSPKNILRQIERTHIFTHIEWHMRGIYITVDKTNDNYTWLTAEQIDKEIGLPTAFRQFWEETKYV